MSYWGFRITAQALFPNLPYFILSPSPSRGTALFGAVSKQGIMVLSVEHEYPGLFCHCHPLFSLSLSIIFLAPVSHRIHIFCHFYPVSYHDLWYMKTHVTGWVQLHYTAPLSGHGTGIFVVVSNYKLRCKSVSVILRVVINHGITLVIWFFSPISDCLYNHII